MRGSDLAPARDAEAPFDQDVVSVELLLPLRQVAALEEAAWRRGLTAGQLFRRLLGDFLDRGAPPGPHDPGAGASG
jgi:hypothetical protein